MAGWPHPGFGGEARPLVVTTNTILADMTRQLAAETVDVRCLVPVGMDLHGFEPRPSDVAALARASLVIANGAGAEPWLTRLIESSGYKGPVCEAIRGCALIERSADDHDHDDHPDSPDPHAWQSAANGQIYARNIRDALGRVAPANAATYEKYTTAYVAELADLHEWIATQFAALPRAQRRIVTSHDALAYFGRAYGLEILPVRGLEPEHEPEPRQIASLVDQLRTRHVRAIFVESTSNPRMLEQLARDTGAILGGEIHTDSVGPADSTAATYMGMLRTNAATILRAISRD